MFWGFYLMNKLLPNYYYLHNSYILKLDPGILCSAGNLMLYFIKTTARENKILRIKCRLGYTESHHKDIFR
jgi:hypothetical protein